VHGGLLLFSGLLLLTPGFVTDAAGFLLLVPGIRSLVAARIWHSLQARTKARSTARSSRRPDVIEGEAVEIDLDEDRELPHSRRETSPWTSRDGTTR
jgi:UPF0716 protein FxsA